MNAFIFLFIYFYGTRISFILFHEGVSFSLFSLASAERVECPFLSPILFLSNYLCFALSSIHDVHKIILYTLRHTMSLYVPRYAIASATASVDAITSSHYSFPCYFSLTYGINHSVMCVSYRLRLLCVCVRYHLPVRWLLLSLCCFSCKSR